MAPHERVVAGLRCSEVLALLSDFIDESLDSEARGHVLAHLEGCDWCERFGGQFANIVAAIRRDLKEPEPLSAEVADRLRAAIERGTKADA